MTNMPILGIHNEPGVLQEQHESLTITVQGIIAMIIKQQKSRWYPQTEHTLVLMVNNLGGLSVLELNVVADEINQQLKEMGLEVVRCMVGTFLTSLDGPGFSVTLLELDDEITALLDAPTSAPA
jgi:dihydroxyacetone kinase